MRILIVVLWKRTIVLKCVQLNFTAYKSNSKLRDTQIITIKKNDVILRGLLQTVLYLLSSNVTKQFLRWYYFAKAFLHILHNRVHISSKIKIIVRGFTRT